MEKKEQQYITDLLTRYRDGHCTPTEQQLVDDWYNELEAGESDYLTAHNTFAIFAEDKLRKNLPSLQHVPATTGKVVKLQRKRIYRWTAAAVFTGLVVLGATYQLRRQTKQTPTFTVLETSSHQIKDVTLPDGTRVWLNRASRIEWTDDPDGKERKVYLAGEARFEVVHDTTKPFIVQTEETATRVLGTEFNVEAYPGEQEVKVALLSGKVSFTDKQDNRPGLLLPGNMMRYRKKDGLRTMGKTVNKADNWLDGAVNFNEVPVKDAVERIARFNNRNIIWDTKQEPEGTVSAVFHRETLDQMLASIAFSSRFRYKFSGNSIIIY